MYWHWWERIYESMKDCFFLLLLFFSFAFAVVAVSFIGFGLYVGIRLNWNSRSGNKTRQLEHKHYVCICIYLCLFYLFMRNALYIVFNSILFSFFFSSNIYFYSGHIEGFIITQQYIYTTKIQFFYFSIFLCHIFIYSLVLFTWNSHLWFGGGRGIQLFSLFLIFVDSHWKGRKI